MFIVTQHYNAMILECVGRGENLEIVTKVHGNVADRIGKPAETGIIGRYPPRQKLGLSNNRALGRSGLFRHKSLV